MSVLDNTCVLLLEAVFCLCTCEHITALYKLPRLNCNRGRSLVVQVLDNLANPDQVGVDEKTEKSRERRAKIKMLREQIKFQLPPYFVLILRAFSVIEGIALKVDPEYSIIKETFPYLSRRLLTDNNEEVRKALRQVLYGDGKRMDVDRFRTLFDSLGRFTTDGLPSGGAVGAASQTGTVPGVPAPVVSLNGNGSRGGGIDKTVVLALQSVFSSSGQSYVQELLVEEMAATLDSLSRGAAVALLQRSLSSSLSTATLSLINSLGPVRRILFPFPLPVEILSRFGNVVTLTEDDHLALRNVEVLWGFMRPQIENRAGGQQQLQLSLLRSFATSVQDLPTETRQQLVAGMGRTSQMVLEQLTQRTVSRFVQDVASVRQQTRTMADLMGSTSAAQPQKRASL
jgi:aarF domain-containing kinase